MSPARGGGGRGRRGRRQEGRQEADVSGRQEGGRGQEDPPRGGLGAQGRPTRRGPRGRPATGPGQARRRGAGRRRRPRSGGRSQGAPGASAATRSRAARRCASCCWPGTRRVRRSWSPRTRTTPRCCRTSSSWPTTSRCRSARSPAPGCSPRPAPRRPRAWSPAPPSCPRPTSTTWPRRSRRRAPRRSCSPSTASPTRATWARCCARPSAPGSPGWCCPKHRAVHVTPTVTKAAAGAVEHLPMALVGGCPRPCASCATPGVWVVGLDAGGDTDLFDLEVADAGRVPGAGGRGQGPVPAGARALRRGGRHPAARPAGSLNVVGRRRAGLLRGHPPPPRRPQGRAREPRSSRSLRAQPCSSPSSPCWCGLGAGCSSDGTGSDAAPAATSTLVPSSSGDSCNDPTGDLDLPVGVAADTRRASPASTSSPPRPRSTATSWPSSMTAAGPIDAAPAADLRRRPGRSARPAQLRAADGARHRRLDHDARSPGPIRSSPASSCRSPPRSTGPPSPPRCRCRRCRRSRWRCSSGPPPRSTA